MRSVLELKWRVRACGLILLIVVSAAQEPPLSQREASALFPLVAALTAKREPFPNDDKCKIRLTGGGARELALGGQRRVVMPVLIWFIRSANTYCRLAVVDREKKKAELTPIPGNYEHCDGMEKMAEVDLNGDGVPDFVFQVNVASNRFAGTVSEGAVFLSQPRSHAYCYAPLASDEVSSDVPPGSVAGLIRRVVEARGPQVLACYKPSLVSDPK